MATLASVTPAPSDAKPKRFPAGVESLGEGIVSWKSSPDTPPLFISPELGVLSDHPAFIAWCREHGADLDRLILEHGAIVLRGFPMATAEDFDELAGLFPPYQPGYVGGMSPRKKIGGNVMESTRLIETYKIALHSEMAYMKTYPPRLAFFCKQASTTGGETIIGDMHRFMKSMPADLRTKLEQHEVHIVRNYGPAHSTDSLDVIDHPDKVAWNDALDTDDRAEAEKRCAALGMTPIWNEDGTLTLLDVTPTFTTHPKTGDSFYRSNLHTNASFERPGFIEIVAELRAKQTRPSGMYLDTGEKLTYEEAETIVKLYESIELGWPWQNGDVMILDNLQVAHGRNTYTGPREIMVALLDA